MQTIVALKEFLTTVEEIICALIYSLEHKKCYAGFFLHSNNFDNSFKFRASNIQLYVFKKKTFGDLNGYGKILIIKVPLIHLPIIY